MIGYLSYVVSQKESRILLQEVRKRAALYTDEQWEYHVFEALTEAVECLGQRPLLHVINWDITSQGSVEQLEKMRKQQKDAFLLVIANMQISPEKYLKPAISPGALLLKPITNENMHMVLDEVFEEISNRLYGAEEQAFMVENREEKLYIPYNQIDYFEAREKKIFVRTGREEFGFYGTLGEVLSRLPKTFLQCHRSYVVNMSRVQGLDFKQNCIWLRRNIRVPYSRSYRKAVKEYKHE